LDKVKKNNTAIKSKEEIVNIYAQPQPEFASTIIASSAGLKEIVKAINKAIEEGKSNCMLYTSDKEPFELLLIRNDESLNTKFGKLFNYLILNMIWKRKVHLGMDQRNIMILIFGAQLI